MSHLTRGAWIEIQMNGILGRANDMSHLTRGAWIEIHTHTAMGARLLRSHLTRGAWIEISARNFLHQSSLSRTSHEVRGLKLQGQSNIQ